MINRVVGDSKADALGLGLHCQRLYQEFYRDQWVRQRTPWGVTPGRRRGQAGRTQGSGSSPKMSKWDQDPSQILIEEEIAFVGVVLWGVPIPALAFSDDWA